MEEKPRPKVGVGVMVFKDGKVLMGKRKNSHGSGQWAPPGGYFEHGESFEGAVKREVKEESGIEIQNIRFLSLYNEKDHMPKHMVNIGFVADWKSGEPVVLEPEKCEGWEWYEVDNLPEPLFATVSNYLEALKTGKNYFDA
jgi:8-oxo-dGTP diphosphatase